MTVRAEAPPGVRQFSAGANCTGLAYTVIDCGGPPLGQKWALTQLAVNPLDPFAAPLAGVQVMALRTIGRYISSNVEPTSFLGIIAPPAPFPNSLTLPVGTVTLGLNERLVVIIQNAPAGMTVLVDFEVHQTALGAYKRQPRRRWMESLGLVG